ncbi:MAG: signal peptidase I [Dehalococcoidales bacterium]|nr:signal peptidase I [Dehalococcoidales bacterium]
MAAKTPRLYGVLYIASLAVSCLILLCGVAIHMAPHFGWLADGVRSGSMSPAITRGSLVVASPVFTGNIALGDIVIYRKDSAKENYICHRVVGISRNSPLVFYTKGDANAFTDTEPVREQNILARVAWHAPVIGFAAIFIKTPVGFLVSVIIPGLTIAALCLTTLFTELSRKKKRIEQNTI